MGTEENRNPLTTREIIGLGAVVATLVFFVVFVAIENHRQLRQNFFTYGDQATYSKGAAKDACAELKERFIRAAKAARVARGTALTNQMNRAAQQKYATTMQAFGDRTMEYKNKCGDEALLRTIRTHNLGDMFQ